VRVLPELEKGVKNHFDEMSPYYYEVVDATPFLYGYYHQKELSLIQNSVHAFVSKQDRMSQSRARILDVGCATGRIIRRIQESAPEALFVGLDMSPRMTKLANMGKDSSTEFCVGDIRNLPFRDGVFDFVYSLEVIEHLDRKVESVPLAISEVMRVTREEGCTILESTSSWHFRIQGILRRGLPGIHISLFRQQNLSKFSETYHKAPLTVAEPSGFGLVRELIVSNGASVTRISWIRVIPEQMYILITNDTIRRVMTRLDELLVRVPGLRRLGREFVICSLKE